MRPARTFGATLAIVAATVALWYAYQDLREYWQAISYGPAYYRWASSSQGVLKLAVGIAEAAATVGFLIVAVRLLGLKLVRTVNGPKTNSVS